MASNEKESVLSQIFKLILAPIIVALLVGGTSPWWWEKVFPPVIISPRSPTATPAPSLESDPPQQWCNDPALSNEDKHRLGCPGF